MNTFTELIIWSAPVVLGLATWALVVIFNDLKEDIKDLKKSSNHVQINQAEQKVQISSLDHKLTTVCKSVETVKGMVHELDKRTANVRDLNGTIGQLSKRLDDSDQNYGKILMIVDGLAKKLGINFKKSGS